MLYTPSIAGHFVRLTDLKEPHVEMNPRFWLSAAFLVFKMCPTEANGQCDPAQYSTCGMSLRGHVFKTFQARFMGECNVKCDEEPRCQSFNVIMVQNIYELNSRTKEARPEDFKPDRHRYYMKRPYRRGTFHVQLASFKYVGPIGQKTCEGAVV